MQRSLKFALRFANTGKRQELDRLWEVYRDAVNFFVMDQEVTGEANYHDYNVKIPAIIKDRALKRAFELLRKPKNNIFPVLTKPCMIFNHNLIVVKKSKNTFDNWVRISTLKKRQPIKVPIKSYDYANRYFKGWELAKGGRLLRNDKGDWFIQLTFKKNKPKNKVKETKGLDIGYRKLITDDRGNNYGIEIKQLTEKASRKKQGSKAEKKVREEIKNYIGKTVKEVVDDKSNVVVEDLKNLKKDKSKKWSKTVNHRFNYWYYGLCLNRIRNRAEVVGVQCRSVPPEYTSQTCPHCGHVERANRKGERFKCVQCGFGGDADHIGALNILARGLGRSLHDPVVQKVSQL